MPRAPREINPEGIYHIIARGNNKSPVFHDANDYLKYLSILNEAKEQYGFSIYHYVLMPNHVHLLLQPNCEKLSLFMHDIQMNYAKSYCKKHAFVGHVWQGRFKSLPIENDAYLFACGNYIEMNPVRAKLVGLAEYWRWSSYTHYACGEENNLLNPDPLFETLGNDEATRRLAYVQLIEKTRAE